MQKISKHRPVDMIIYGAGIQELAARLRRWRKKDERLDRGTWHGISEITNSTLYAKSVVRDLLLSLESDGHVERLECSNGIFWRATGDQAPAQTVLASEKPANASPEPDAVRETAVSAIKAWRANPATTFTPTNILREFGDAILAALSRPAHGENVVTRGDLVQVLDDIYAEIDVTNNETAMQVISGLVDIAAEAMWRRDYPNGGSVYKTYDSLPVRDKNLHRKEAVNAAHERLL